MNWNGCDVFCHVVEHGGFTAAARALGQPKSSISDAVQRLEGELGTRLLERTTRRLRLTEAGDALYHRIGPLLASLRDARSEAMAARSEVAGTLRIASPYEFGAHHLGPVACKLMAAHPNLRVQLDVTHAPVNPHAEPYDIVFAMLEEPPTASSIIIRRMLSLERGLFASPVLLRALGTPKRPADLAKWPLVASSADTAWSFTDASGVVDRVTVQTPRLVSNNAHIRLQAAVAGFGVTRVTASFCQPAVKAGTLRRVLANHVCDPLRIYAMLPARRLMPEKVRRFLDALEDHARTFG